MRYVSTLPCEIRKSENVTDFDIILNNCGYVPEDT